MHLCTRTGWMTGAVQNTCGQPRVFQHTGKSTRHASCPCGGSLAPRVACVWPRLLRRSAFQKSRNLEISNLVWFVVRGYLVSTSPPPHPDCHCARVAHHAPTAINYFHLRTTHRSFGPRSGVLIRCAAMEVRRSSHHRGPAAGGLAISWATSLPSAISCWCSSGVIGSPIAMAGGGGRWPVSTHPSPPPS
jgi:hypothetical protein